MLEQPLTAESAVRIALLNNPDLKASLAELGVSAADLAQAGRLRNPEQPRLPRYRIAERAPGRQGAHPGRQPDHDQPSDSSPRP